MAASTDYNYTDLLSLDKAKLVERSRDSYIGKKEFTLEYSKVTNVTKEECIEWLEDNRLSLTDPKFGFRTYTGTWYCVSIAYIDAKNVLQQRFSIDGSILNDVAERSAGVTVLRSYYPKCVNPEAYGIPLYGSAGASSPSIADMIWHDSCTDNDGDDVYYDSTNTYAIWYKTSTTKWYITVVASVGTIPTSHWISSGTAIIATYAPIGIYTGAPVVSDNIDDGETWTKRVQDNGDGTFDVMIEKTTEAAYDTSANPSASQTATYRESSIVYVNSDAKEFVEDGGDVPNAVVGEIKFIDNSPNQDGKYRVTVTTRTAIARRLPEGLAKAGKIDGFATSGGGAATVITANAHGLSNGDKVDIVGTINYNETGTVSGVATNTFIVDIAYVAEDARGTYCETTTTIAVLWNSDYEAGLSNKLIIGRNQTYDKFETDLALINPTPFPLVVSISITMNDYGLYDYTLRGMT